jgi:hypothetical protein
MSEDMDGHHDHQKEEKKAPVQRVWVDPYKCPRCGRSLTHVHAVGYICEVCNGIDA